LDIKWQNRIWDSQKEKHMQKDLPQVLVEMVMEMVEMVTAAETVENKYN